MKILMLGWELPPHFAGGMGIVCYNLCDYLARSGADIDFILPFEADFSEIDFMRVNPAPAVTSSEKISYEDLNNVDATTYGKGSLNSVNVAFGKGRIPAEHIHESYIRKVTEMVLYEEYDVIHAHDWLTMRAAILAKQVSGLPLIVHIHATEFDRSGADEETRGNEMIHEIEYQGMQMADKVVAVSQRTKNIIVNRYGIDSEKVEVIHNSIDITSPYINYGSPTTDEYRYLKTMKANGYSVISNIGRHTLQKGLSHLLEAAKIALEKNPKILFLMIGSGDQHRELIERSAELGISNNFIFTGFQGGIRVREAFAVSDAFVMPSVSEPFGTTPMEAMSLGTPVIISKQSGVSELIKTAFKVDFWDVNEIAAKIIAVTMYPTLKQYMLEMSLAEAESFTYKKPARETKRVYHHVLGAVA